MNKLDFDLDGVESRRAMLTHEIMNLIKSDIELDHEKLETYGIRNLEKRFESISSLASSDTVRKIARSILVQYCTYFSSLEPGVSGAIKDLRERRSSRRFRSGAEPRGQVSVLPDTRTVG